MARLTFDWSVLPERERTRTMLGVDATDRTGPPLVDPLGAWTGELPPVLAGRYTLGDRRGRGGGGEVYRARDRLTGEAVAIKLLPERPPAERWRVRRELTALRWLRLPGVVRMRDSGVVGGHTFIVMDEVLGTHFPGVPTPMPWEALEPTVIELLEILARVHHAGVIHRDLKPGNVLVDAQGRPVVLDFGIAHGRALFSTELEARPEGTPAYVAPEQISGKTCDGRTDLYAVGAMLFEALTGEAPHGYAPFGEVITRRLYRPAPPVRELAPETPPQVAGVIDRLLARDPADRFASAAEVLEALGAEARTRLYAGAAARLPSDRRAGPDELRALFRGPDPFLHLAEDGALVLWGRTGGWPRLVVEEVASWVRAGLAWWEGDLLVVDRPALERLRGGLVVAVAAAPPLPRGSMDPEAQALLGWIRLSWPHATPTLLAALTGLSDEAVRDGVERLRALGVAWRLPQGRVGAWPGLAGADDPDARQAAARALAAASPPRSEARLHHLLMAEAPAEEVLPEVLAEADARLREGQHARAMAALELGIDLLYLIEEGDPADFEDELLLRYVLAALSQEAEPPMERALYELGRATATPLQEAMTGLVQGALLARRREPERALQLLDALPPFEHEELELWRQGTRCRAAAQRGLEAEAAHLQSLEHWAESSPQRAAKLAGWRGNHLYRQGRYREAAEQHLGSLAGKTLPDARLASRLNAGYAFVEALYLEEAAALATEALAEATHQRHPRYEALATLLQRMVAYRLNRLDAPRPDLVEAAAHIGAYVESQFSLTEAAMAWRVGELEKAAVLAERARVAAQRARGATAEVLAEALAWAVRGDCARTQAAAMAARALMLRETDQVIQVLGLLTMATPDPDPAWLEEARRLAACRPVKDWCVRLDVLSFNEALSFHATPIGQP